MEILVPGPITAAVPDEPGILWIPPDKAAGQVDRVMGGSRINVARLNVALDAVK